MAEDLECTEEATDIQATATLLWQASLVLALEWDSAMAWAITTTTGDGEEEDGVEDMVEDGEDTTTTIITEH